METSKTIWNYLIKKGFSKAGVAGIIGNMDCESGLRPNNLQDTYNHSLGLSDEEYVRRVDNGTYSNFIRDQAGFGLAQWTWWQRKSNLLNFCKQKKQSIGDLITQLDFFEQELRQSFSGTYKKLITTDSVREASNAMLYNYEAPAAASSKEEQRYQTSLKYYNKYAKGEIEVANNEYIKGQKKQLSKYFVSTEMDCHGSGCCSKTLINPQLIEYLNQIREHFNSPVTISSGYRCTVHNSRVGGATGSRHTKGDAADIIVKGYNPKEVAQYAESIGIKGIGLYETAKDGFFVHIDTRDKKSFWYGQAQAYRDTFGGNSTTQPSSSNNNYMKLNDQGGNVKALQKMLISLGYDLGAGKDDGIYGPATISAVKQFQKDKGLVIDGLAGQATLNALYEATNSNQAKQKITVTANLLNVRIGPGINYAIVDRISKGAIFDLLEINNGWGRINKGWVSMQYVQ